MSWFNVVKEDKVSYQGLNTTEETYLYEYTQMSKIRWHKEKVSEYMLNKEWHKGKWHREFAEKMIKERKAGNRRYVLDMEGNVITDAVRSDGKLWVKTHHSNIIKPKLYGSGNGPTSLVVLHDRFTSGTWTIEDMIDTHGGKIPYKRWLMEKYKEAEGL